MNETFQLGVYCAALKYLLGSLLHKTLLLLMLDVWETRLCVTGVKENARYA